MTAQDELSFDDMKYLNEQFGYGYDDEQIWDIIHTVGGYGADQITFDRYNKFIDKKINKRKLGL